LINSLKLLVPLLFWRLCVSLRGCGRVENVWKLANVLKQEFLLMALLPPRDLVEPRLLSHKLVEEVDVLIVNLLLLALVGPRFHLRLAFHQVQVRGRAASKLGSRGVGGALLTFLVSWTGFQMD
jgi:hypothetical protein